jgi:hypothetical protein
MPCRTWSSIAGVCAALVLTTSPAVPKSVEQGLVSALRPAHTIVADISGDPVMPRRHFRVRNPKRIGPEEAAAIYRRLRDEMAAGYVMSGRKVYEGWTRYNRAPYLSATHGRRYVNNYANRRARAYGRFEQAGRLPVGSLLAKDSFAVTRDGEIHAGPLFIMEKMAEGFNYVSGDWRYTMIMPDGSVFGVTKGENAKAVEYCIGCHLAVEKQDHLYFPPPEARVDF